MLVQADDPIVFHQLSGQSDLVGENKFEMSLLQATGAIAGGKKENSSAESKLSKVLSVCNLQITIVIVS